MRPKETFWPEKTVLITAGPTREYLDPIRFLTNDSSGRMGFALAEKARALGAKVLLVSGPARISPPKGVRFFPVFSAAEMRKAVLRQLRKADVVIASAAVSDWRFSKTAAHKIKKTGRPLLLRLVPNPDILKEIGELKKKGKISSMLVGFALETRDRLENAAKKLRRKNLDLIVANTPFSLGGSRSRLAVLSRSGSRRVYGPMSKKKSAGLILHAIERESARSA